MFDRYQREIHYLRLSVTDLCNLRCRYCMPDGVEKLEREAVLTYEEFLRLAALFAQCGIDTVRVTGGEPLVRKNVAQLVAGLKATPGIRRVTLTTNAVLLAEQLPALLDAGLDSVNISLDTLRLEVFRQITARDDFAAVQAGLQAALESGLPVKLNCVPQAGVNEGELEALAALAKDNAMQVRFIEMMPIGYGAAMPCISGPELRARFARRWPELAASMREDLGVRERGFFAPGGPVRAVLKGDTLILTAQTQFVLDIIKNPRVQQLAAQKASAFFGRPMQAQFALAGQTDASGKDPMDALIARGKEHSDIMTIR